MQVRSLKIKVFISFLMLGLISCSKQLEIKPYTDIPSEEALSNTTGLEALMNGGYRAMAAAYSNGFKIIPDLMSDEVKIQDQSRATYLDIYQRNFGPRTGTVSWNNSYDAINRANNVIGAIVDGLTKDQNTPIYQANKDRLYGEALFLRAIMHWELVRLFGAPYGTSRASKPQSGIVLRLKASVSKESKPRASVNEVYSSVISDLEKAVDLLPLDVNNNLFSDSYRQTKKGRATKSIAYAYLAKIHFQMATVADNQKAIEYVNLALSNDVNNVSTNNYPLVSIAGVNLKESSPYTAFANNATSECVLQIISQFTNTFVSGNDGLPALYSGNVSGTSFPAMYLSLFKAFNPNDLRSKYKELSESDQPVKPEFNLKYLTPNVNIQLVRSAELLLIRAEANILNGNTEKSIPDLDAILTRAYGVSNYGSPVDKTSPSLSLLNTMSQSELLRFVLLERSRELYIEGDRIHQLRRIGSWNSNVSNTVLYESGASNINGGSRGVASRPFNDPNLLILIPDAEVFANPEIDRGNYE